MTGTFLNRSWIYQISENNRNRNYSAKWNWTVTKNTKRYGKERIYRRGRREKL